MPTPAHQGATVAMSALLVSIGAASDRAAERAARLAHGEAHGRRQAQVRPDSAGTGRAADCKVGSGDGRPLGRHEWVELLVRAAVTRYVITGEAPLPLV